jgi:NitT/TauT family transport system substrate-binding protein
MKQLRIGYLSTLYHTSHILKQQQALGREAGLCAQWILFGTGPAMIDAFSRGALDIGYIGLPPAMIGRSRGLALKCIAGGHIQGTVVIAGKKWRAATAAEETAAVLAQFAGKPIGAPARGSIHDIIIRDLLKKCGLATEVRNYPWADLMPQAIADGEIAAAAGTPALAAVAAAWYDCRVVVPPGLIWPFNPSCGIVVHEAALETGQSLKGFLALHEQACNLLREKPDEASLLAAAATSAVGAGFVREVFAMSPHYCAALPAQYRRSAMAFVPVLLEQGLITRGVSEQDMFDRSLIEEVHPQDHHY